MIDAPGRVMIAPGVLVTIARLTTLSVPGVLHMCSSGLQGVLRRGGHEGVLLQVDDNSVLLDLYIISDGNANLREVGRNIQTQVARAIRDMVGMEVSAINIHIQDVAYPESENAAA